MPKYLLLDLHSILEFQISLNVNQSDLTLGKKNREFNILKNGKLIVDLLNELVNEHDYQILFHSQITFEQKIQILNTLKLATQDADLTFPPVHMTRCVNIEHSDLNDLNPHMINKQCNEVHVHDIVSGSSPSYSKQVLRRGLEKLLHIDESSRQNHIVFDGEELEVKIALTEGYQAYKVDKRQTLYHCLKDVLEFEKKPKFVIKPIDLWQKFLNLLKILFNFIISMLPFTNADHLLELESHTGAKHGVKLPS